MQYQVISTYYQLALEGRVPELYCRIDNDHGIPIPRYISDDHYELECIYYNCTYKRKIGLNLYNYMYNYVAELNDELNSEESDEYV